MLETSEPGTRYGPFSKVTSGSGVEGIAVDGLAAIAGVTGGIEAVRVGEGDA